MSKTALITGASSGIGLEFARIHAKRGGNLIVVARSADKLNALKRELEEQNSCIVTVIEKDLVADGAAREVYDAVKAAGIEVDYLINNAGFGGHGKFHERAWEQDLAMIKLNVVALTELTRLFLPDFVARGRGRVLNVSSTAGMVPGPLQAVYFATKAYVTSFSNAIAEELHDTRITVTALLPGATETGFASAAGLEKTGMFEHGASARSVARDGYEAMLDGRLEVISGLPLSQKAMLRAAPMMPKRRLLRQVRQMQEARS